VKSNPNFKYQSFVSFYQILSVNDVISDCLCAGPKQGVRGKDKRWLWRVVWRDGRGIP